MIAILNYGLGNLGSISNMLKVIGEKNQITDDPETIKNSDGIILPGVGAFDAGMKSLNESGLTKSIKVFADTGKPILGICLGMQLLGDKSEEGSLPGLSLIPFECKKFKFNDNTLKIPHMGWDTVHFEHNHPILNDLTDTQRYYFVHSYHAICHNNDNVLMSCDYGYKFAAAVVSNNIIGVQFHPEKSHDFGLALLSNFVKMCRSNK